VKLLYFAQGNHFVVLYIGVNPSFFCERVAGHGRSIANNCKYEIHTSLRTKRHSQIYDGHVMFGLSVRGIVEGCGSLQPRDHHNDIVESRTISAIPRYTTYSQKHKDKLHISSTSLCRPVDTEGNIMPTAAAIALRLSRCQGSTSHNSR
jgi:hypothetical protein